MLTRSPAGRLTWDRLQLGIPGFGAVLSYQFYAQFARTMGTLLQNGVTLLRTMELLEDMSGNTFLKTRMADAPGRAHRRLQPVERADAATGLSPSCTST